MSQKHRIHIPDDEETARYGAEQPADAPTDAAPSEEGDPVEALRKELDDYKDKFLRAKAEHQNYIKRAAAEREDAIRYANIELVRALLDVLDDLERTEEAADQSTDAGALVEGVRLIREKFAKVLTDRRVALIEARGKPFDPAVHEAMMQTPSDDVPAGAVVQEFQPGYTLDGRVVRPAKVAVSSGPVGEGNDSSAETDA